MLRAYLIAKGHAKTNVPADPISKLNRGVENSNIAEPDAEVDDESPTESVHLSRAASRENGSKADQLGAPFGQHVGDHPRGMLLRHHNNGSSPAKLAGMVDDLNKARLSGMIDHANEQLYTLTVNRARLFLRITRRRQRHRRSFHIGAAELHPNYTGSPQQVRERYAYSPCS